MSTVRRLFGASKVEKKDDLDAFMDFYNNNNKLYLRDLGNLRSPSIRNLPKEEKEKLAEEYKRKHMLHKDICYYRHKMFKMWNGNEAYYDPNKYNSKKVGNILGAELWSDTSSQGEKFFYWVLSFTNATVQWLPGDENKKWFEPCSEIIFTGGRRKTRRGRKQRRRSTRRKQ